MAPVKCIDMGVMYFIVRTENKIEPPFLTRHIFPDLDISWWMIPPPAGCWDEDDLIALFDAEYFPAAEFRLYSGDLNALL